MVRFLFIELKGILWTRNTRLSTHGTAEKDFIPVCGGLSDSLYDEHFLIGWYREDAKSCVPLIPAKEDMSCLPIRQWHEHRLQPKSPLDMIHNRNRRRKVNLHHKTLASSNRVLKSLSRKIQKTSFLLSPFHSPFQNPQPP